MTEPSRDRIVRLVREQLDFIRTSIKLYDEGKLSEAKRLGTSLRTLLHDRPPASHALLVQSGHRDRWQWTDTAIPLVAGNKLADLGLVAIAVRRADAFGTSIVEYVPLCRPPDSIKGLQFLAAAPQMVEVKPNSAPQSAAEPGGMALLPFDDWWQRAVLSDADGLTFSRWELVRNTVNKDGGAHVDPKLPAPHEYLASGRMFGWTGDIGSPQLGTANPVLPCLRQIAEEFMLTVPREEPRW